VQDGEAGDHMGLIHQRMMININTLEYCRIRVELDQFFLGFWEKLPGK